MENPNSTLFPYCPSCGKMRLSPDCEKSFICKKCGFIFYLNTASACAALIFNDENQLLITRRKYDPAKGMLDLPGGFTDPGETLENCLKREVKEELNIELAAQKYFCSHPNQYRYKNILYPVIDSFFLCRVISFSNIIANDDVSEFYFLDVKDIDTSLFGLYSTKLAIEQLKKENFNELTSSIRP